VAGDRSWRTHKSRAKPSDQCAAEVDPENETGG